MKEIGVYFKYILLVKMSLFSICKSSGYLSPPSLSLFPSTTGSQLPLILSLYTFHFIASFPVLVEGNFDVMSPRAAVNAEDSAVVKKPKVIDSPSSSPPTPTQKMPKEKTLFIPDRTPANFTPPVMREEIDSGEVDEGSDGASSTSSFNMKAVERTLIVITGIAVIILSYLGIKFFIKARKFGGRYGIVETSEMDLLEKMEEDEEESEEEELFDINSHRRRPF